MSTITILYDNQVFDRELKTEWGFSALFAYQDKALLFDTGGNGMTLLGNMGLLGIDPTKISTIVLSHKHNDHTGGISELLSRCTHLYPPFFFLGLSKEVETKNPSSEGFTGTKDPGGRVHNGRDGRGYPRTGLGDPNLPRIGHHHRMRPSRDCKCHW